ncbi:MAG: hypothetical protein V3V39_01890 [Desulfobacterales bacterium]
MKDNLAATDLVLTDEDIAALDELTAPAVPYPAWMQAMGWDEQVKTALGIG